MRTNGDAIYGTRPWQSPTGETAEGIGVRFTQKGDAVYAVVLGPLEGSSFLIRGLHLRPGSTVELLGLGSPLSWEQRANGVAISLLQPLAWAPAHSFRISPAPGLSG